MKEPEKTGAGKKHGCLAAVIVAVAVLCLVFSLFYAIVWHVPVNELKARKMGERGKARYEEIVVMPKEQNGWYDYTEAFKNLDLSMVKFAPGGSVEMTLISWVDTGVNSNNEMAIKTLIAKNRKSIDLVGEGHKKKTVGIIFDLPTQMPINSTLNYYIYDKLFPILILSGDLELKSDRIKQAAEMYLMALGMCRGAEPVAVGNLYERRMSAFGNASERLSKVICQAKDDDPVFRYIIEKLVLLSGNFPGVQENLDSAFFYELESLDGFISDKVEVDFDLPLYAKPVPLKLLIKREKRIVGNFFLQADECVKLTETDSIVKVREIKENKKAVFHYSYLRDTMSSCFISVFGKQTICNGLILAAALRLYKSEKGKYPDRLPDLIPEYFKILPVDHFSPDGKFCYRKNSKSGVLLYSQGANLKDEGGKHSSKTSGRTGDLFCEKNGDMVFFDSNHVR
jgi:hypothetical protein